MGKVVVWPGLIIMRLFLGCSLLFVGIGFCMLESLAHALIRSPSTKFYYTELQSFPVKEAYSRAEVLDAVWSVWTNRMSLPSHNSYTEEELKTAFAKTMLLGAEQEAFDRKTFEGLVGKVSGHERDPDSGLLVVGVILMLAGSFLMGNCLCQQRRSR